MAQKSSFHGKYKGVLVSKTNTKKIYAKLQMERKKLIDFLVKQLSYIGEASVKIAREQGDYNDITGNLRSSISYIVLNDGEVKVHGAAKQYDGKKGSGAKGVQEGEMLLKRLQAKFPWGVVLVVCAGMEYAAFVENVRGRRVLIDAELEAERLFNKLLGKLVKNV